MQYKSVKGFSGGAQLGILIFFWGLGMLLSGGAEIIIGMKMLPAGTPMEDMGKALTKAMMDPKNVALSRLLQVVGTCLFLFIPAVLYSLVVNGRNKFWLGFNPYINVYQVLIGFFIIFVANIAAAPLADMSKALVSNFHSLDILAAKLEKLYNDQVLAMSHLKSIPELLMAIVIMAFFPALFEEVFFRGALQNLLVRWWKQPMIAIFFTSLLFSLIHMSVYLFLSRLVLGFVLGLLYHKTRNIWVNVIAHFLNNCFAVIQLFWMSNNKQVIDPGKLDPKVDWWLGVIAFIVLYILFRLLKRFSVNNQLKVEAREQLLLQKEGNSHHPFEKNEIQ